MRRVALAGVLSMKPEALILDEPTAGLDPQGREDLLGHIEKLHRERSLTVIMVTHRPCELLDRAHGVLMFHQGKIALSGHPREVFSQVEELARLDMELPTPVRLAHELRRRGMELRQGLLTEDEVCDEITRVVRGEEEAKPHKGEDVP